MDFDTKSEPFNIYTLADGTTVKIKHVLMKVERNGVDAQGKPQFNMNFAPVVHIEPKPVALGGQHSFANQNLGNYAGNLTNAQNALNTPKKDLQ